MIANDYSVLFGRQNEGDELNINNLNTEIPSELKWISFMDRLSGKDITKHDNIYEQNYIYCLSTLTLWYYEDQYYKQVRLAQQNQKN